MLYNCTTCIRSLGIVLIGGIHRVKCSPKGLRDLPLNGCSGWVGDEDELKYWPERIGEEADVVKGRGGGGL
jgi:hypothetical protein